MSNLKMKEAVLIYLDRSGGLQKFINDCKYYNGKFSKGNFILETLKYITTYDYPHFCICVFLQIQNRVTLSIDSIF